MRNVLIIWAGLLIYGCGAIKDVPVAARNYALELPDFNREGHRGIRGLLPENTIPSMYLAIDHGVNTIEVDVVISGDRQVVVSHDVFFHQDITTTPEGRHLTAGEAKNHLLYRMDYDSIRKYDVGLKPHPGFPQQENIPAYKPLLSELVDSVENYLLKKNRTVIYNIELKTNVSFDNLSQPPVAETVDLVMEVVKRKGLERKSYLQSFDFRCLRIIHEKYPGMVTAVLIGAKETRSLEAQLAALGYVPQIYSPHFSLVNASLVQECRSRGMKLVPWTVNDLSDMQPLKDLGVDGIITDYANLFEKLK